MSLYLSNAGQGPETRRRQDVLGKTAEEKVLTVSDGFPYQKASNYGRKPDTQALGSKADAGKWTRGKEGEGWKMLHSGLMEM